ncbi:MAG TPA: hypothetical protein VN461_04755 [Vicinamibacteria bacterium]|jgi:hypothetical protein|nr:hypothetical protein [Vicinamibacteria bacterium]
MRLNSKAIVALSTLALLLPLVGRGDTPGRHPRYLRARSDLRTAWLLLRVHDEPNVMREVRATQVDIERAIREIDRAAVLDRKDIDDHPPIDTSLDRPGRFLKVMALLDSGRADIAGEEDNPYAVGWRNLAYRHVDAAKEHLRRAAVTLRLDRELGF